MSNDADIFTRIQEQRENFSAKQLQLADYIEKNYKTAAFLNSTKLAKLAGVSGSTVIRFAEELGYDGFPQLQTALHSIVQMEITTLDSFVANTLVTDSDGKDGFFRSHIETLKKIEKTLSTDAIQRAIEQLSAARNIFIAGFQGSAFLANYTTYFLSRIRGNVVRFNSWDGSSFNLVPTEDREKDVALIFAFPRFPLQTYALAKFFSKIKIPMICVTTITDNIISRLADTVIHVELEYRAYVDRLAPVLYISEYIVKGVANMDKERSIRQFKRFEEFAQENKIFLRMNEKEPQED